MAPLLNALAQDRTTGARARQHRRTASPGDLGTAVTRARRDSTFPDQQVKRREDQTARTRCIPNHGRGTGCYRPSRPFELRNGAVSTPFNNAITEELRNVTFLGNTWFAAIELPETGMWIALPKLRAGGRAVGNWLAGEGGGVARELPFADLTRLAGCAVLEDALPILASAVERLATVAVFRALEGVGGTTLAGVTDPPDATVRLAVGTDVPLLAAAEGAGAPLIVVARKAGHPAVATVVLVMAAKFDTRGPVAAALAAGAGWDAAAIRAADLPTRAALG